MFRKLVTFMRTHDPALILVIASLAGIAIWFPLDALPGDDRWLAPTLVLTFIAVLPKTLVLVFAPMTIAATASAHAVQRRLLQLGAVWAAALFVLISGLALARQPLVVLTAHEPSERYAPASGNHPDVGLWAVTWPPTGWGAQWMSDDYKSPLLIAYPRMWRSGQIYGRELLLAGIMVAGWLVIARLVRRRWLVAMLVVFFSVGILILADALNGYLIWDYDFFHLGIWSDSVLFDVYSLVFPTVGSLVSFTVALTIGLSSLLAMRLLRRRYPAESPSGDASHGTDDICNPMTP